MSELASFIASIQLGNDVSPIDLHEAEITLCEWELDRLWMPDGINAENFANEWNRQYVKNYYKNYETELNCKKKGE